MEKPALQQISFVTDLFIKHPRIKCDFTEEDLINGIKQMSLQQYRKSLALFYNSKWAELKDFLEEVGTRRIQEIIH